VYPGPAGPGYTARSMIRVRPFLAIRPRPGHEVRVASLPYDVLSTEEARAQATTSESFLHVIRPEIDLPPGVDPHGDAVYQRGRENLDRMIEEGTLVQDQAPRIYLYRQVREHRRQVGIVCCCHVEDYYRDLIRKHEKTRPDKEDDRTRHVLTLNAHTGPVFLTYRDDPTLARLIAEDMNDRPLYHFNAPDGVTLLTATPRPTDHTFAEDPRQAD